MKLLLFLAFSSIGAGAFAQVPNDKNTVPDTIRNFKGDNGELLREQFQKYFERKKRENQLLADKQGNIVRLPQDHMPCVVPDSVTVAVMPNAWGPATVPFRPQYQAIPNPALPSPSSKNNTADNSAPAPSK